MATGMVALFASSSFVTGAFVPYYESNRTLSLADLGASFVTVHLVPGIVGVIASLSAVFGSRRGAGIAVGATIGMSLIHGVMAAMLGTISRSLAARAVEGHVAIGFHLHTIGAVATIVDIVVCARLVRRDDWSDVLESNVIARWTAILFAVTSLCMMRSLMRSNAGSDSRSYLPGAVALFAMVTPLIGAIGAIRRTRTGYGIAFASATTLFGWMLAGALQNAEAPLSVRAGGATNALATIVRVALTASALISFPGTTTSVRAARSTRTTSGA